MSEADVAFAIYLLATALVSLWVFRKRHAIKGAAKTALLIGFLATVGLHVADFAINGSLDPLIGLSLLFGTLLASAVSFIVVLVVAPINRWRARPR